ncbi:NTF2-related export protein 1/2, partial [Lecanoromycetidae sp. Uapishka_2]
MATLSADQAVKVSTEAATDFVDTYYQALNSSRFNISSFYMPASTMPDGKPLPVIVYNGNVVPDPSAMQALFLEQMPDTRYEVQDYDAHVLNPHYIAEGAEGSAPPTGKNMTILITISGYVKYGEPRTAAMRGFSENIVLIPNPVAARNTRGKPAKEWLIQSQNFRLVV